MLKEGGNIHTHNYSATLTYWLGVILYSVQTGALIALATAVGEEAQRKEK